MEVCVPANKKEKVANENAPNPFLSFCSLQLEIWALLSFASSALIASLTRNETILFVRVRDYNTKVC